MKKLPALFLLCTGLLFGAESQVDVRLDTNPTNLESSLHLVNTTAIHVLDASHAVLVTPEVCFFRNGSIDFSATATHRHAFDGFVVGHSIFFDRTNVGDLHFDQAGTGFDFLTDQFDFRANYYHPLEYATSEIKGCKWADAELFFKGSYFGIGTGPVYNIDMKSWALHSRMTIPCKSFTFHIGALCGQGGLSQAIFSVSFHLFKQKATDNLTSHPAHVQKSSIYYNPTYRRVDDAEFMSYLDRSEGEIALGKKES